MSLDQVLTGVAAPEVIVNANFVPLEPSALFGYHASATAGLVLGIYGGNLMVGTTPTLIAAATLTLTASATNYVEATTAGVVSSNTTAFTAGRIQIGIAVTGTATITSWTDKRTSGVGGASSSGGSYTPPTGTGFAHITSGAQDGAAVAIDLSTAHVTGTLAAARMPAHTGDVTSSAGALALTLALGIVHAWTKNQSVVSVAITSAATLSTDASLGNTFVVNTLAVNATLANPTNLTDGMVLNWIIKQDATGSRTLAYGTKFKFFGGAPTLSTAASAIDMISGVYNSTLDIVICQIGKAAA